MRPSPTLGHHSCRAVEGLTHSVTIVVSVLNQHHPSLKNHRYHVSHLNNISVDVRSYFLTCNIVNFLNSTLQLFCISSEIIKLRRCEVLWNKCHWWILYKIIRAQVEPCSPYKMWWNQKLHLSISPFTVSRIVVTVSRICDSINPDTQMSKCCVNIHEGFFHRENIKSLTLYLSCW